MFKISSRTIKEINRNKVYQAIYNNSSVSKKQIMSELNMSAPTIYQYLDEFFKEDLLYYDGYLESTGGRKAQAISCNFDAHHSIGIDITPSRLGVVAVNLKGTIKDTAIFDIPFMDTLNYYKEIVNIIKKFSCENSIGKNILGIGVSLPAIISKSGRTINFAPLIHAPNLAQKIEEHIDLPVKLFNDANAGGFAEIWYLKNTTNMVYLSLSNTVGSAILLNGNLYYGDDALSGEVGHTTLYPNGKVCYCGRKGCVDSYCSARALTLDECSLKQFFICLNNKEQEAMFRWDNYLNDLALTINNIHNILDCKIIIGGYVGSYLNEEYLSTLREKVSSLATFNSNVEYVKSCVLKNEASAVGAALYYIDLFIKSV